MKHPTDWEQVMDMLGRLGVAHSVDASNPSLFVVTIKDNLVFTNSGKHVEPQRLPQPLKETG